MNVRDEIANHSDESDKPILNWLFDRYHMESQWHFVARCKFVRYGTQSYETNRVWIPTYEGRVLYNHGQTVTEPVATT